MVKSSSCGVTGVLPSSGATMLFRARTFRLICSSFFVIFVPAVVRNDISGSSTQPYEGQSGPPQQGPHEQPGVDSSHFPKGVTQISPVAAQIEVPVTAQQRESGARTSDVKLLNNQPAWRHRKSALEQPPGLTNPQVTPGLINPGGLQQGDIQYEHNTRSLQQRSIQREHGDLQHGLPGASIHGGQPTGPHHGSPEAIPRSFSPMKVSTEAIEQDLERIMSNDELARHLESTQLSVLLKRPSADLWTTASTAGSSQASPHFSFSQPESMHTSPHVTFSQPESMHPFEHFTLNSREGSKAFHSKRSDYRTDFFDFANVDSLRRASSWQGSASTMAGSRRDSFADSTSPHFSFSQPESMHTSPHVTSSQPESMHTFEHFTLKNREGPKAFDSKRSVDFFDVTNVDSLRRDYSWQGSASTMAGSRRDSFAESTSPHFSFSQPESMQTSPHFSFSQPESEHTFEHFTPNSREGSKSFDLERSVHFFDVTNVDSLRRASSWQGSASTMAGSRRDSFAESTSPYFSSSQPESMHTSPHVTFSQPESMHPFEHFTLNSREGSRAFHSKRSDYRTDFFDFANVDSLRRVSSWQGSASTMAGSRRDSFAESLESLHSMSRGKNTNYRRPDHPTVAASLHAVDTPSVPPAAIETAFISQTGMDTSAPQYGMSEPQYIKPVEYAELAQNFEPMVPRKMAPVNVGEPTQAGPVGALPGLPAAHLPGISGVWQSILQSSEHQWPQQGKDKGEARRGSNKTIISRRGSNASTHSTGKGGSKNAGEKGVSKGVGKKSTEDDISDVFMRSEEDERAEARSESNASKYREGGKDPTEQTRTRGRREDDKGAGHAENAGKDKGSSTDQTGWIDSGNWDGSITDQMTSYSATASGKGQSWLASVVHQTAGHQDEPLIESGGHKGGKEGKGNRDAGGDQKGGQRGVNQGPLGTWFNTTSNTTWNSWPQQDSGGNVTIKRSRGGELLPASSPEVDKKLLKGKLQKEMQESDLPLQHEQEKELGELLSRHVRKAVEGQRLGAGLHALGLPLVFRDAREGSPCLPGFHDLYQTMSSGVGRYFDDRFRGTPYRLQNYRANNPSAGAKEVSGRSDIASQTEPVYLSEVPLTSQETPEEEDFQLPQEGILQTNHRGERSQEGASNRIRRRGHNLCAYTKPCRYFSRGKCTRGANCEWAHGDVLPLPDFTNTVLCQRHGHFWPGKGYRLNPNVTEADLQSCKYAHSRKELRRPTFSGKSSVPSDKGGDAAVQEGGKSGKGGPPPSPPPVVPMTSAAAAASISAINPGRSKDAERLVASVVATIGARSATAEGEKGTKPQFHQHVASSDPRKLGLSDSSHAQQDQYPGQDLPAEWKYQVQDYSEQWRRRGRVDGSANVGGLGNGSGKGRSAPMVWGRAAPALPGGLVVQPGIDRNTVLSGPKDIAQNFPNWTEGSTTAQGSGTAPVYGHGAISFHGDGVVHASGIAPLHGHGSASADCIPPAPDGPNRMPMDGEIESICSL